MAVTAMGTSPWPVIMTTTCLLPTSFRRARSSILFMPGRRTSKSTHAGCLACSEARNSSALAKPRAGNIDSFQEHRHRIASRHQLLIGARLIDELVDEFSGQTGAEPG